MQAISYGHNEESEVTRGLELRFLPAWVKSTLSNILESNPGWREIMGLVPGEPWKPGEPIPDGFQYRKKYTWDNINTVSEECSRSCREGFEALLEEWGTSGKKRPMVQDLIHLLQKNEFYRALDYLTVTVMKEENQARRNNESDLVGKLNEALQKETAQDENNRFGTYVLNTNHNQASSNIAEAINMIDVDSSIQQVGNILTEPRVLDVDVLEGMNCSDAFHFDYSVLKMKTNNFLDVPLSNGGNLLGEGAFGKVYLANIFHKDTERLVAIKRLNPNLLESRVEQQFKTEIEILSSCKHINLVPLEGYSCDGPEWCLVYAYMPSGSLQDCLACSDGKEPLDWKTRVNIGKGSASGIVYLHTYRQQPLVHRDIKSANILLDENFCPKIGDFGLVRLGGSGDNSRTLIKTTTVFGTSAYMAPEAFRGDVSVKMDTFSFGVVLLELLTGMSAFDEDRLEPDLLNHVLEAQAEDESHQLPDEQAGDWDLEIFNGLLALAILCGEAKKNKRPNMVEALQKYSAILNTQS